MEHTVKLAEACREFGHAWQARTVARLIQNGKIVGTVNHSWTGWTVNCYPHPQLNGLTLEQLRDIMSQIQDGKPLAEIFEFDNTCAQV